MGTEIIVITYILSDGNRRSFSNTGMYVAATIQLTFSAFLFWNGDFFFYLYVYGLPIRGQGHLQRAV